MSLHWIDLSILSIVGLSVITGLFRGFAKELISVGVWCLAFWLAYNYASSVTPWVPSVISDVKIRLAIAGIVILFTTLFAGGIFSSLLGFVLSRSGLSSTDRLLGAGFGFIRGGVIVAIIILGVNLLNISLKSQTEQSILYAKFTPIVKWMESYVPEVMQKMSHIDVLNDVVSTEQNQTNEA